MFAVAASNVNGGLVAFFHGVQVAVMMSLMTNILQFAWWKLKKKKGTHWQRKGPLWILLLASIMVLTQPVCTRTRTTPLSSTNTPDIRP